MSPSATSSTVITPTSAPSPAPRHSGYGYTRPPRAASTKGSPYVRGMFSPLVPLEHIAPEELRSVEFALSASGRGIIVSEHSAASSPAAATALPRRLLAATSTEPYFIMFALADGSEVTIEVRRYTRDELRDDELGEVPDEEHPSAIASPTSTRHCALFDFGGC